MSDFLPPCEVWPNLLLTAAWGIAVVLFVATIRSNEPLPAWRWGDRPRRPKRFDPLCAASFFAFALITAFAVSYAVNHPLCD